MTASHHPMQSNEAMTIDVLTEMMIDRPRADVAGYAADPDNATSWYRSITAVRWETPRPVQLGTRVTFEAQFLGRTLAYTYEIRELEAGRRLLMSTAAGPFPMETTYAWEDTADGGTSMTLRNRGRPSGFARLAAPLLAAQVRRATARDLRLLKSILEGRSDGAGSHQTA